MARPVKDKTILDMPFGQAMERFIGVRPKELRAKTGKPPKRKPKPKTKSAKLKSEGR